MRARKALGTFVLLLGGAVVFAPTCAAGELDALRLVAVQDGGRVKPLDTFARESARRVTGAKPFTGGERVKGLDAVEWVLAVLARPEQWRREPIVRVAHAGLREEVGLPSARDRYTFEELASHEGFLQAAGAVFEKARLDVPLTPQEQEIATLHENLTLFSGLLSGEALRIVPVASGEDGAWLSVAGLGHAGRSDALRRSREATGELVAAYARGDRTALSGLAERLRASLAEAGGAAYPSRGDLEREVRYNQAKPFRLAWLLFLPAFLFLLASFPLRSRALAWAGTALAVAGLASTTCGMVLRTLISGRAPVTNMYETVVFVAWGAVLLALVFELVYGGRYASACASGLAVVALILADNVPIFDGSIAPLVPVLRDNVWLTLHVLTITLGYAAFFLAMGLGHLNLGLFFFAPGRAALLKTLSLFLYRSLQVGTFFLAVGTLLGGVWASYSWGRFWGWDPKETWALIALLGYLAVLHARFIGWLKDFGMAVGSILGFLLVLMAWYGVNYILGTGLHSYGFGSGGTGWIVGFLGFELVVIVLAFSRRAHLAETVPAARPALPATR
jgi:ABC-type transport system involved in cytochrome c biogenesis permease subunit